MDETSTIQIKDKYLAMGFCVILLIPYTIFMLKGLSVNFLENVILVMIGVFGGLLKSSGTIANATKGDVNVNKPE